MSENQTKARIGVDIGGTFTDVVLEHGDELYTLKLLTQLEAPENGVREGVSKVLDQASLTYEDVGLVIHGTTLATNSLIERKGARTAMITTEGFRDTIDWEPKAVLINTISFSTNPSLTRLAKE